MKYIVLSYIGLLLISCGNEKQREIAFNVIDTDFSKGRLAFEQKIELDDLVKFHGHLCDGLVVGGLAMEVILGEIYPNEPIDRTNLRVVSAPSPCLTDVGAYLSGGRYQYNTFFVDEIDEIYIVQRIDTEEAFSVRMKPGVKPSAIDSLGAIAVKQELPACDIDELRKLEDDFTEQLLKSDPKELFELKKLENFEWNPVLKNDFLKTDVLNKGKEMCIVD